MVKDALCFLGRQNISVYLQKKSRIVCDRKEKIAGHVHDIFDGEESTMSF